MTNRRTRIGFLPVALAILSMTFLGGCTPTDAASLETFLADLLRNAGAALLL